MSEPAFCQKPLKEQVVQLQQELNEAASMLNWQFRRNAELRRELEHLREERGAA